MACPLTPMSDYVPGFVLPFTSPRSCIKSPPQCYLIRRLLQHLYHKWGPFLFSHVEILSCPYLPPYPAQPCANQHPNIICCKKSIRIKERGHACQNMLKMITCVSLIYCALPLYVPQPMQLIGLKQWAKITHGRMLMGDWHLDKILSSQCWGLH